MSGGEGLLRAFGEATEDAIASRRRFTESNQLVRELGALVDCYRAALTEIAVGGGISKAAAVAQAALDAEVAHVLSSRPIGAPR